MKIGVLIDELAPGSAPKVIGQTSKGLNKLGHQCQAISLVDNGQRERFPEVYSYHLCGLKIRFIFKKKLFWDFRFPGFSFFSLHHILSFFKAPLAIKSSEFDLILANAQTSAFAAWGLRLFRKIPYIFYVHCDPCSYTLRKTYKKTWLGLFSPLIRFFAGCLDKFSLKFSLAVITSGTLHQERFRGLADTPIEILRLGCFPEVNFNPYSLRQQAILAYDRWDIGNNPSQYLEIMENLPANIKLKLAGFWHPQRLKEEFIKKASLKGLLPRIELLTELDEPAIKKLCSEVMLHMHLNQEAFGMQSLEAAGCGCCIIIPCGSGVADLFRHGQSGYFPQENNPQEVIEYTKLIFSDIIAAQNMGKNAWEIAKRYTWDYYAQNLNEIILKYYRKK